MSWIKDFDNTNEDTKIVLSFLTGGIILGIFVVFTLSSMQSCEIRKTCLKNHPAHECRKLWEK